MSPIVTAFILASSIKAQYIDVADLAANTAFINALTVKHLEAADGVFYGTLQFPFVDMVQNITLDHTAGSGTSKYFVMESDDPTSLYLKASDRYSGTPYSSGPIYNYLELPSDMPDGVIVNIISDGKNVKNVLRPFYLHVASGEGNKINYGTNPDSGYIGNSILSAHMLTFPDLFFIRLLSFGGEWYVVQILGQFTASTES